MDFNQRNKRSKYSLGHPVRHIIVVPTVKKYVGYQLEDDLVSIAQGNRDEISLVQKSNADAVADDVSGESMLRFFLRR